VDAGVRVESVRTEQESSVREDLNGRLSGAGR
jgi:hypothetical protein